MYLLFIYLFILPLLFVNLPVLATQLSLGVYYLRPKKML